MTPSQLFASLAVAVSLAAGAPAFAQKEKNDFTPSVGQPGKDVIWVPTPQALVDKMLDMARAAPGDYVMDLGSGDGRLVITAAKRGIEAMGVEYDPKMVDLSRRNAEREGVAEKARFVKQDLFKTDLTKASVITMFLLPALNIKLRPKILALKPGTRVVSNSFDMGEWEADEMARLDSASGCEGYCTARLWIVPARVAGTHKTALGQLKLKQEFQKVTGTLTREGREVPVEGKVVGEEVVLKAGGQELRGRMEGQRLQLAGA
jgi:precorrin-6B methylase 2